MLCARRGFQSEGTAVLTCRKRNPIIYMTDMEDSHNKGRQAGADVEITPEMIEAGYSVLVSWDRDFTPTQEVVAEIFRAMERERGHRRYARYVQGMDFNAPCEAI